LSTSLTRLYQPVNFTRGQIKNAFKKLPGVIGIDAQKSSLTAHLNHPNGIKERKNLVWSDLDTITEIKHNALSCLMFSYQPIGVGSFIIYIESQFPDVIYIHCETPDMDKTNNLVGMLEKELRLEIKQVSDTSDGTSQDQQYIDRSRLQELKNVSAMKFDLSRLIRILEEMNACYKTQCYISVITLTRAMLDHVPPIFSYKTFSEVANNYTGSKSFKESMKHLDNSSRKIADQYLHTQIRHKEALPNKTQVNFSNDIDVLLSEIVRVLK
jgi:hypothetical protein